MIESFEVMLGLSTTVAAGRRLCRRSNHGIYGEWNRRALVPVAGILVGSVAGVALNHGGGLGGDGGEEAALERRDDAETRKRAARRIATTR